MSNMNIKEILAAVEPDNFLLYSGAGAGFLAGLFTAGKIKNATIGSHMTGEQTAWTTVASLAVSAVPKVFMEGANPLIVGFVYGFSAGSATRFVISGMAHPRH